jgi:glycosyltransferase involved in cell wall biosynthesis
MKALLSAYACEPGKGSEPEVGWRVALEMANHCDVTVITRRNNREPIENELRDHNGAKPTFLYYDLPKLFLWLKRHCIGASGYYILWQIAVRIKFSNNTKQHDLVHHVTFNGIQLPGFWFGVSRPVVLGSLGGGMTCPTAFLPLFGKSAKFERFRTGLIASLRYMPWWRASIRGASVVLAANQETADVVQRVRSEPVPVLLETAISKNTVLAKASEKLPKQTFRILWLGSLIPRKAANLALLSFAEACLEVSNIELIIAGGGSQEASLRDLACKLGVAERVHFLGKVPKDRVNSLMDECDAFFFTSLRDTSGNVVLEAMARALPVIVLWHQGMKHICNQETAMCVSPTTIDETVKGLAEALMAVSGDLEFATKLGEAGLKRVVEHFSWSNYGMKMMEFYRMAVAK